MPTATELHERATALEEAGALEEALAAYEAAAAQDRTSAVLPFNIGATLRKLKRFGAAIGAFETALARAPGMPMARFMRATCLLQLGDLLQGFRELEARKDSPGYDDPRYALPSQWAGQAIQGRTLFIYPEWFLGDLIQFGRYALLAQAAGARVILAAPIEMHALLRTMSSQIELIGPDETPTSFDYAAALVSLPAAFGTQLQTVPRGVYLHPEPHRVARWRERIGAHGFKVGIVWAGSDRIPERSFPLAAAAPLAQLPGVRLISLQKARGLEQLADLPAVEQLGDDFDPGPDLFLDTAAAIAACDLVISIDTSVIHLAGAMGRPAWLALNWLGDWRWLEDRADSPWYPSVRIFRQAAPGDWGGVFRAMAAALAERAS